MLKMPKVRRTALFLFSLSTTAADSQYLFFLFTHDIVAMCTPYLLFTFFCRTRLRYYWISKLIHSQVPLNLYCASFFFWLGQVLRRIYLYLRNFYWLIFFGVIVIEIVFTLRDIANVCISHVVKRDFYLAINKLYLKLTWTNTKTLLGI